LGIVCSAFCLSVRLSVTSMLCDETKEYTADILITHNRVIPLVFWHQQRSVGDIPLPPEMQRCSRTIPLSNAVYMLAVNVTLSPNLQPQIDPPIQQKPISTCQCLGHESYQKCSIITYRKSTISFPTSSRWIAYVTPKPRPLQRVAQKR